MFVILHFFLSQLVEWCFAYAQKPRVSIHVWPLKLMFSHGWLTLMFCSCPDALSQQLWVASGSLKLVFSHSWLTLNLMFCSYPYALSQQPGVASGSLKLVFSHSWLTFDVLFMPRCPEPAAMSGQWISEARLRPQSRLDSKWLKTNIQVIEIKTNL